MALATGQLVSPTCSARKKNNFEKDTLQGLKGLRSLAKSDIEISANTIVPGPEPGGLSVPPLPGLLALRRTVLRKRNHVELG